VIGLIVFAGTRPRPGESVASQGNRHLKTVDEQHEPYNTTPPTSGPHLGGRASWGVHTEQIQDELQVHNLEDGGVIVHYDPAKVDEMTIQFLRTIVNNYKDKVILEPYSGLETLIILTAWTRIDKLPDLDEQRMKDFINAYRGIDHHVAGG
jgi:hypothetical protein